MLVPALQPAWLGDEQNALVDSERLRVSALAFELTLLMQDVGRLASDICLYSTQEFGFIVLPERFTTGSSIMPQKRNPDLFELLRGRAAQTAGELHMILRGHQEAVLRVAFLSEDRLVSSSVDGTVRYWYLDAEDVRAIVNAVEIRGLTDTERERYKPLIR